VYPRLLLPLAGPLADKIERNENSVLGILGERLVLVWLPTDRDGGTLQIYEAMTVLYGSLL